jgi:hypothetical protein
MSTSTGTTASSTSSSSTTSSSTSSGGAIAASSGSAPVPRPSGLSASVLLHRLNLLVDGVQKHKAEPGFPSFFAINDLGAVRDMLAVVATQASAAKAQVKALAVPAKAEAASARALYSKGVQAIESWLGLTDPRLEGFGIKPRKGPASPHAVAARTAKRNKRAKQKAQAGAASVPASSPSSSAPSSPASPSSPSGGQPAAGSTNAKGGAQ